MNELYAQNKKISIHSENNQVVDKTFEPATQYLNGDVKVYHASAFMYCDTAILKSSDLRMRHNVVLLQNDTIKIFSDSLHYNGDSLVAYLYGDIILENGPTKKLYTSHLKYDVKNKIAYYTKNAKLIDKTSTLISKRGRYVLNEKTAYFYENVKASDDDFTLVGDSLAYNTSTQETRFLSPVRIIKDTSNIYSKKGWFDLDDKIGDFIDNAQYLSGKTKASADTISYDGKKDQITLKTKDGRSEYISEKDTAFAKIIYYDKKNETFILTENGHYKSTTNEVKGEKIYYNKISEKFKVTGRSVVSDPPMLIEADTLDYDKAIKFGKADGHVIWQDTSAKTAIHADHVVYEGNVNKLLATNDKSRPLFTTAIENDTLFMRADTLKSFRTFKERLILPDKNAKRRANQNKQLKGTSEINFSGTQVSESTIPMDSTQNITPDTIITDTIFTGIIDTFDFFVAYHKVRIFKSDLQAVCDSLVFSKKDSIFTLYQQPFAWSDSSQISGDTLDIFMKNKKLDKLTVKSQAAVLNSSDYIFFNQIQGRFIETLFKDSKINQMNVDGNAKIVYYLTNEAKEYSGVNTTEASRMTFYFDKSKVTDIFNYVEPKSIVFPMQTVDHESIKIKGFKWNLKIKPISKEDLNPKL